MNKQSQHSTQKPNNLSHQIELWLKKHYKKVLVIIVFLGAVLRLKGTLLGAFAFTYDSARDMIAVQNIIQNHDLNLIGPTTGLPGLFYGPWWYWFLIIPFVASGGDPMAAVVLISLICLSMIPLSFWLAKQLGTYTSATATAIAVACSPLFIASSVQLWSPNFVPFFTLLALILYWRLLQKSTWKDFFLLGLVLGGAYHSEVAYGIFFNFSMTCSLFIVYLLKKRFNALAMFLALIGGFFFTLIPQLVFDMRHNFLQSTSLLGNFIHPKVFQKATPLIERFVERGELFFSQFIKMFALENPIVGIIILIIFGYMIFKILKSPLENTVSQFTFGVVLTILIMWIGFSLFPDAVWEYYLVGVPVLYLGLFAVLSGILARSFKLAGLVLVFTGIFIADPFTMARSIAGPKTNDQSMIRSQKAVIDRVYADADGTPFSVVVYTPTLVDYPYAYLFDWYGNKTYHYVPMENQKVVYYILEKDSSLFRRHWIGEHDGDGQIIFEETTDTGVIIQKRMRE